MKYLPEVIFSLCVTTILAFFIGSYAHSLFVHINDSFQQIAAVLH